MARQITAFGTTIVGRGTIVNVNAENTNQLPSLARVVGLIGEAESGPPGVLVAIRDATKATALFGSGPLVDAIRQAFDASTDAFVPGGPAEVVVYKTNPSTRATVDVYSYNTAAAGVISLNTVGAAPAPTTTGFRLGTSLGLTVSEAASLVGHFARVTVATIPYTVKITAATSGATTDITFTPALPAAPVAAAVADIYGSAIQISSRDFGVGTNQIAMDIQPTGAGQYEVTSYSNGNVQISPGIGGKDRFKLAYVGGGPVIPLTAATGVPTTTVVPVAANLAISYTGHSVRITVAGTVYTTRIVSNTTGAGTSVLTVSPALPAAPVAAADVTILNVTSATARFGNNVATSGGKATQFVTTITGVTGDNLAITIGQAVTLRTFLGQITANTNYVVSVPNFINQDTTLAKDFDFTNVTANAANIQDSLVLATTGFRQDVQDVVSWINTTSSVLTATRAGDFQTDGGTLNIVAPVDNDFEGLVLAGGTRGTSDFTAFQAGFDAMLTRTVDIVVPLVDEDLINEGNGSTAAWAEVAAQLVDHVDVARSSAGLDRGGVIGFKGNKTQIIAAANSINDTDVQLVCQNPTVLTAQGQIMEMGPRILAAMTAGMRCGMVEIGEPLTNKFIKTAGVTQDTSWDPNDVTDQADFTLNGVLFCQNVVGRGTRWFRDLTTWVQDDNLAWTDGSVRDVVRVIVNGLRNLMNNRFIGHKATPATITSIKEAVASLMEVYRQDNLIVDSTDPISGQTVKAYHNLQVFATGDVATINVGIFPVPGLNFAITNISLDLASQLA